MYKTAKSLMEITALESSKQVQVNITARVADWGRWSLLCLHISGKA